MKAIRATTNVTISSKMYFDINTNFLYKGV
jgi:hypothetical protein